MEGWNFYVKRDLPHIGIMHETYIVPKGNYENIYHNFRPFAFGKLQLMYGRCQLG